MPTIVTTRAASDFLALVPHLAGFLPRNSLVLVAFRGNRTRGAMRFDLPPIGGGRVYQRIATTVVGMLSKLPEVDAVVPVIYTEDAFGDVIPHETFMREVLKRAEFCGFHARDALCVAADGWASYFDDDYPAGGHRLEEIDSAAVRDAGLPAVDELLAGVDLPRLAFDTAERVAVLLRDLREEMQVGPDDCLLVRWPMLHDLPAHMESALFTSPDDFTDEGIALLILLLQRPSVRDAVTLLWAFDLGTGLRMFDLNRRFRAGEDVYGHPEGGLMLGQGPGPDPDRIHLAIDLLRFAAARAPRSARPPLLCMLAWLTWALGRSSAAGAFLELAIDIDPRYGLSDVLATMLRNGMLPEWAFT